MLEKITNNYCKTIILANENKVDYKGKYLVPMTQAEIAKELGLTRITINSIFKELYEDGLIEKEENKYYITNKAITLVEKLKEIKD